MSGRVLAFFPAYTTLVGGAASPGQDFFSEALEVVPFRTVVLEALLMGAIGTGAAVRVQLEQGSDLQTFTAVGSEETLAAGTPATVEVTAPARYLRLRVNLRTTSGTMAATLWALATAREA